MKRPPVYPAVCFLSFSPVAGLRADPEIVAGPWCGAVTPVSASVTVHLGESDLAARLVVSTEPDLGNPLYSRTVVSASASGDNVRLDIGSLTPDTTYHYAVELNGVLQDAPERTGNFRTFPSPGAASFRFCFASCGDWNESGQDVYQAIQAENPRFFIHMGDLHYRDTNETDPDEYRSDYIRALSLSPEFGQMVRNLPTSYIWDDHDFAGNNSDRESNGRTAARLVYREMVPHYPLPAGGPDEAIHQRLDYGRVRFLLSDLRSEKDDDGDDDDESKSIMGAGQKQWFKDELLAARDAEVPLVVWLSGVPFVSDSSSGDNWGSYTTERLELLEFIRDQDIRNLMIISGDMHALAYDDGRATEEYLEGVRIPIFHGAALTRDGSEKGGPYSGGVSEGSGRYGIMDITDAGGGSISATFQGRIASSAASVSTWETFNYEPPPIKPRAVLAPAAVPIFEGVRISWTDDSSVETGFRIERRTDEGPWIPAGTLATGISQFDDTGTAPGAVYDYRLITLNETSESFPSPLLPVTTYSRFQNWKVLRFGDPADPLDDDGDDDGLVTIEEYLFDLLPTVPDRYPWSATAPDPETGEVTVGFQTSPGRNYQVHFSGDLTGWAPVSPVIAGDGSLKQWTDDGTTTGATPAPEGKRFYRISVSEAP